MSTKNDSKSKYGTVRVERKPIGGGQKAPGARQIRGTYRAGGNNTQDVLENEFRKNRRATRK